LVTLTAVAAVWIRYGIVGTGLNIANSYSCCLIIGITGTNSCCKIGWGKLLASENTVAVLPTQFVVIRIGTIGNTITVELKCVLRADTPLIACKKTTCLLPCVWLIDLTIADFKYLISTLFVYSGDGPIRTDDQDKRRFVVEVKSGFQTAGVVSNIREDGVWEGVLCKVFNL
jgi:hypothetical protein